MALINLGSRSGNVSDVFSCGILLDDCGYIFCDILQSYFAWMWMMVLEILYDIRWLQKHNNLYMRGALHLWFDCHDAAECWRMRWSSWYHLKRLPGLMNNPGYVLHDLEDKEEMAFCLCCHGEKVTVVFGLISRTHVY